MSDLGKHFDDEAEGFDNAINKNIPRYDEMIEVLVNAIPNDKKDLRVLDLGCGTGNITLKLLERFPKARVTCLDLSKNMLELAKKKLSDYDSIEYVLGDFTIIDIIDNYDAVISSLALHHIASDEAKLEMYRHIYDALNDGGVFYNADVTLASTEYHEKMNQSIFDEFMENNGYSPEEIENHRLKRKANDLPITLTKHLRFLEEVGFKNVDVIWKYYATAVYGAIK
ncbi:MAG: 16S rRNA (cytosine(1402)-N(4))-methyltransferase [Methanosphaera sp. rholeuAM130]|nr:class I SAM-dependent methyltransferase [Methanosphaera sp.]RAP54256.1 MAG: 16S rRNA (cytosine(1402)-N(4))-methyltransferase [Methanosphaera sp. rholeuAM130]